MGGVEAPSDDVSPSFSPPQGEASSGGKRVMIPAPAQAVLDLEKPERGILL